MELIKFLKKQKHKVIIYDPFIEKLKDFQSLDFSKKKKAIYDSLILSVPHNYFLKELKKEFLPLLKPNGVFFDIKGKFRNDFSENYWSL